MPVGPGESLGRLLIHRQRRRDVEQRQPAYGLRVVHRQAVGHPRAAIVCEHIEPVEAEPPHHGEHVARP